MIGYLHIGLEKTGSTSIQHFLNWNKKLLQSQGFLYPVSIGDPNHGHSYLSLIVQSSDKIGARGLLFGVRDEETRDAFRKEVSEKLKRETSEAPKRLTKIVFTDEQLHGRIHTTDEVLALRNFLVRFCDVEKVIAYVRRQDRLAVSLSSTLYKGGFVGSAPVFPDLADPFWRRYYDYASVLDPYVEVFGARRVEVRVFERRRLLESDLIRDFCDAIELIVGDSYFRPPRVNRSLSAKALTFLSVFNRHVPLVVNGELNLDRSRVTEAFEALFAADDGLVSRADAEAFYSQFKESNEALRQRFLPQTPAPLFEETFDDYPEKQPEMTGKYEDAVEIAAALWTYLVRTPGGTGDR